MDVGNGPSVAYSQNMESTIRCPVQEGVPEISSKEGQNKEFSFQASATDGTLNDNINNEGRIYPAEPNTDEKAMVWAQTEPNLSQENWLLQKRVRPPRYFDPQPREFNNRWQREGWNGIKVSCMNKKLKKKSNLCFMCGRLGHKGKECKQVIGCIICNRKGHVAIDCPDKNTGVDLARQVCLKCGRSGHDMFSCANEYDPDDLKAVRCYICKKFGHLCCAENRAEKPAASCYNCGQLGHFGSECTLVNDVANDLQQPLPLFPKSGEGIVGKAADVDMEKETAVEKCGKRKKSRRKCKKRKKIKATPMDYPSDGQINPAPTRAVVGPVYGKPGSSVLLPPEVAAAIASHQQCCQRINNLAGTQVGNVYYPTARPPHLIWNSQSGGRNPQLPPKQYRQAVVNIHGDEAGIPRLFYRAPEPPHTPQDPLSDPQIAQNSINLAQNHPRPPPFNQNATPISVVRTLVPRPLNHLTETHLPHQKFHPQPVPQVSHQNSNIQIGNNVPRTQAPHTLNHQPGIHLPHEIVHGQHLIRLNQTRSDLARTQVPQLLNHQSGSHPHLIHQHQSVALLPHQNSESHAGSITRTQIPRLVNPQTGFLPHQIAHSQAPALPPRQNSGRQGGSDVARTQIPHLLNPQTRYLPHQIHQGQPQIPHPLNHQTRFHHHQIYQHYSFTSSPK